MIRFSVSLRPHALVILFAFVYAFSSAQEIRFDHLSVDQGLSQGNVWSILQDKRGFLWIGTEDGLNMFDGYSTIVFRSNPDDPTTISNNNIHCITQDKNGNVWIGTQDGLNFYDRDLNRFERFLHDPNDIESISNNDVGYVYFDSKNTLWAGTTSAGLNRFDATTKKFKRFVNLPQDTKSIADNFVKGIVEDNANRLWVATMGGLSMMQSDGSFVNYYHDPNDPNSLSSNKTTVVFEDHKNNLWIGTFDGGMNMLEHGGSNFKRYPHRPADPSSIGAPYVYDINENSSGELWVATDGSLCKLNDDNSFTRYVNDQGNDGSIGSNIVTSIFFDVNERMWVGTRFGGVNIYDKGKYSFHHYKHNNQDANSLRGNTVASFAEDEKGNIWIGVDGGGLNYFDRGRQKFSAILSSPTNKNSLTNDKVLAVKRDHLGELWIGMWAGGLNRYNPQTGKFTRYLNDPKKKNSLSDNNIFHIIEDSKGNIWIATWGNGISKYNRATDDFTQYVGEADNPNSIASGTSPIVYLMEDHAGKIWIATEQEGLKMFDPETSIFTHYKAGEKEGDLTENAVFVLFEDSRERLWVGTNGGGLCLFDGETKKFKAYRERDGLPNDAIMGILEDNDHNLWISTNKGISKFNPDSVAFQNYNESDGLQGNQFMRWAFTKLSTGELLFGGTNGFNMFDPAVIKDNPYVPPVYITDFRLFNKEVAIGPNEVLSRNILLTDEIVLSYTQNFITFEFTALNYRQTEKNEYKYIMEGFQEEWIDAGNERKVSYTNLSPGEYIFKVIGSNNDGVWNQQGASVRIRIVPPFWRTLWFISLVVLSIIASVIAYVRYQKVKAKRQQQELEAIIEARTGEVQKQSDEIMRQRELEKVRNWITEGLAYFSEIISKHKGSLDELAGHILSSLVRYVNASQGTMAVGVKDDPSDEHLKIVSTYGVSKERLNNSRIELGEGLIGAAYHDKQKKYFESLPSNYLTIESGLGVTSSAKLMMLPLMSEDGEVHGVVELAFLNDVDATTQEFLEKVSSVIALNIHAANLNHKTTILLQQSKEQTEELRAQEEEMRQNMEELEATQEELRRREQEYQDKIVSLENEIKRISSGKSV